MNYKSIILDTIAWIFGIIVFAIGVLNVFWGNDAGFGVFLILLSFAFFPLVNTLIKERMGITIPVVLKILLGIFILWAALGVGELFNKIHLMMMDL
jgi:hypothetical protein